MELRWLDLAMAFAAGLTAGLLIAAALDEIEHREGSCP